jgi:hypothetical protein
MTGYAVKPLESKETRAQRNPEILRGRPQAERLEAERHGNAQFSLCCCTSTKCRIVIDPAFLFFWRIAFQAGSDRGASSLPRKTGRLPVGRVRQDARLPITHGWTRISFPGSAGSLPGKIRECRTFRVAHATRVLAIASRNRRLFAEKSPHQALQKNLETTNPGNPHWFLSWLPGFQICRSRRRLEESVFSDWRLLACIRG